MQWDASGYNLKERRREKKVIQKKRKLADDKFT